MFLLQENPLQNFVSKRTGADPISHAAEYRIVKVEMSKAVSAKNA